MIWIIIIVALVSIVFYYKFIKPLSYWKDRGVPTRNSLPVFGDTLKTFLRMQSFTDFILESYKIGPGKRYCGVIQSSMPALVIKDADLLKQITIKDFDYFIDRRTVFDPEYDPMLGKNLLGLKGHDWRNMRALLSPSFTSSRLKSMFVLMQDAAKTFAEHLKEKDQKLIEIELKELFSRYSVDIIASTAFGVTVDSMGEPNNTFYRMARRITNFSSLMTGLKMLAFITFPQLMSKLRFSFLDSLASSYFADVIRNTIKIRQEKGIIRPDMLNLLLEARKSLKNNQNGKSEESTNKDVKIRDISDTDIMAQAFVFFLAGFETVSTALSFACYELACNPDIQKRLREEIVQAYKENDGKVSYDILQNIKYLEMVISETLRRWPIAIATDRICTKPYTIEPTQPSERPIHLKKGDVVWFPIVGLHWDPVNFPNPEKFDPERFSDQNKSQINPYVYMPFGSGPRMCIGNRFALLEIKVVLFEMLRNFEIIPTKDTKIPLKISKKQINLFPDGGFHLGLKRLGESQ